MAFIKKLNTGGYAEPAKTNPYESFSNFISHKLRNTKFTKKGEEYAKQSAQNFIDLYNQENFNDIYSYDPISQQYTINPENIKDETLKNKIWGGSGDDINTNILGKYSGRGDRSNKGEDFAEEKKFNTMMASWINEYSNLKSRGNNTASSTTPGGISMVVGDLWKYISENGYNDPNGDFAASKWGKIDSIDTKKRKIQEYSAGLLDRYLVEYEKNPNNKFKENELNKAKIARTALTNNDWFGFRNAAIGLGWDIDRLLDQEKFDEAQRVKTDAEKAEEEKRKADAERKAKIDAGTPEALVDLGFVRVNDAQHPLFSHLNSNEALYQKDGKFYILDNEGNPVNRLYSDREHNKGYYGGALQTTGKGTEYLPNFSWSKRNSTTGANEIILNPELKTELANIIAKGNPLVANDPSNFINIFGGSDQIFPLVTEDGIETFGLSSGDNNETIINPFGHYDPTMTIFRKTPTGYSSYRRSDDGSYKQIGSYDENYQPIEGVELSQEPAHFNPSLRSYSFNAGQSYPYYAYNLGMLPIAMDFNNKSLVIPSPEKINADYIINEFIRINDANKRGKDVMSDDHLRSTLINLIKNSGYKNLIFNLPSELSSFLKGGSKEPALEKIGKRLIMPRFLKGGGIKKMQEGSRFSSFDDYLISIGKKNAPEEEVKNNQTYVNPTHTQAFGKGQLEVKNDSLDKAIMASNIATLTPGVVGVGAGLIGTVLEAYKDFTDDDTSATKAVGNLALNLGLAGAAFFGGGFLKTIKTGTKVAKSVKVADVASTVSKMDKATDVVKVTKGASEGLADLNKSINTVNKFEKSKAVTSWKTANKVTGDLTIEQLSTIAKSSKKPLSVVEDLNKLSAFSKGISESKQLINLANTTSFLGKTARGATTAMVIGNAASNLPQAMETLGKLKDVASGKDELGNITTDDINSLVSVLYAGKIGGLKAKQFVAKKYGTVATNKTPSNLSVEFENGQTLNITDASKLKGGLFNKIKGLKNKGNNISAEDKQTLLKEYNKINKLTGDKALKELPKIKNVGFTESTQSGFRIRREGEIDHSKNPWLQYKATQWANRYRVGDNLTTDFNSKSAYGKLMDRLHLVKPNSPLPPVIEDVKPKATRKPRKPKVKPFIITPTEGTRQLGPIPSAALLPNSRGPVRFNPGNLSSLTPVFKKGGQIPKYQLGNTFGSYKPSFAGLQKSPSISNIADKLKGNFTPTNLQNDNSIYGIGLKNKISDNKIDFTPKSTLNFGKQANPASSALASLKEKFNPVKGFATGGTDSGDFKEAKTPAIDKIDLMNLGQYVNTMVGNRKAAKSMIKGEEAKIYKNQLMSKPLIKAETPNSILASANNAKITNQAGRIARANTNLALGTSAQLSAIDKSSDNIMKANLADQQIKQQTNQLRNNVNLQIDQHNIDAINKNKQIVANAESNIHNILGKSKLADVNSLNTLMKSYGENYKVKDVETARANLANFENNPAYQNKLAEYNRYNPGGKDYGEAHNNFLAAMKQPHADQTQTWETSQAYLDLVEKARNAKLGLDPFTRRYGTLQKGVMYGVPNSRL